MIYNTKDIYNIYVYIFWKIFSISYYSFKRAGFLILREDCDTTRVAKMSSRLSRIRMRHKRMHPLELYIMYLSEGHKTHIIFILMFHIIRTHLALENSGLRDVAVLTLSLRSCQKHSEK